MVCYLCRQNIKARKTGVSLHASNINNNIFDIFFKDPSKQFPSSKQFEEYIALERDKLKEEKLANDKELNLEREKLNAKEKELEFQRQEKKQERDVMIFFASFFSMGLFCTIAYASMMLRDGLIGRPAERIAFHFFQTAMATITIAGVSVFQSVVVPVISSATHLARWLWRA